MSTVVGKPASNLRVDEDEARGIVGFLVRPGPSYAVPASNFNPIPVRNIQKGVEPPAYYGAGNGNF